MRIAYFVGPYPVYSETFVLHQLEVLLTAGHEVRLFAETQAAEVHGAPPTWPWRLEEMPARPLPRLLGLLRAVLQGEMSWPLLRSLNPFRFGLDALSLRLPWSVWKAGANAPFDILYAHFGAHGRKAALLKQAGAIEGKLVTVLHGDDISGYPRRFRGQIYEPLFATGDLFLPISDYGRQKLEVMGCPPDRMQVLRMGVNPNHFVPLHQEHSILRILTVARFVPYKGLATAITALAKLSIPFEYRLIGDGPMREELICLAQKLRVEHQVKFCGIQSSQAVLQELQQADLFLLPSETQGNGDEEGIPVALMEAMACEIPVVSTFHSGIPELIENGKEGILVPERDLAALVAALTQLGADPELRRQMGQAGRRRILQQYNSAELDQQLLCTLKGLA
ncbi:glycosyltransferase [Bryobacter aggregatus]|uniref:glycosyltransferase n=1 Tax=Bryobacter aggregatus TaxID=360054 RepID=UPI00068CD8B1|nr:glycosyltransferase [Bryobacter aggregatus]